MYFQLISFPYHINICLVFIKECIRYLVIIGAPRPVFLWVRHCHLIHFFFVKAHHENRLDFTQYNFEDELNLKTCLVIPKEKG